MTSRSYVYRVPARISVDAPLPPVLVVLRPSRRPQSVWHHADGTRENMYAIECIRDGRLIDGTIQYLVQWAGYPADQCTWLYRQQLVDQGALALVNEFNNRS